MNLKERDRLAVFRQVQDKRMTLIDASRRLGISYRQARRLRRRYRQVGDAGLAHQLRGRPSNNQATCAARRTRAIELYDARYQGFGPTLAAEQMAQRDGLIVNHETLRGGLIGAGRGQAHRDPRRVPRRRERRGCFGELVQLDGSDHAWLGADHARCTLMVMIDDATGHTEAWFFDAETTVASMTILGQWIDLHGLPRALYPDRHRIDRRNDKRADAIAHRTGKCPRTRFGEAMAALGVALICAHGPQAKGRVERQNRTRQDRLVKLLELEGITTIGAANAYLQQTFLPAHNARFTVEPGQADNAHRPAPSRDELDATLCPVREQRVVNPTGGVSWRGRCFELIGRDASPRRRRQVIVRQRLNGRIELLNLSDGRVLNHREPIPSRRAGTAAAASSPGSSPESSPGSATSRSARLRCAAPRPPTPNKGTLLFC